MGFNSAFKGLNNWTKYNQDQVKWMEVVEKAKTFTQ